MQCSFLVSDFVFLGFALEGSVTLVNKLGMHGVLPVCKKSLAFGLERDFLDATFKIQEFAVLYVPLIPSCPF